MFTALRKDSRSASLRDVMRRSEIAWSSVRLPRKTSCCIRTRSCVSRR